jgi:chromosome segregation ATPase
MRDDLAAWNWQMAWQRAYDAALDFQAQLRDREAKLAVCTENMKKRRAWLEKDDVLINDLKAKLAEKDAAHAATIQKLQDRIREAERSEKNEHDLRMRWQSRLTEAEATLARVRAYLDDVERRAHAGGWKGTDSDSTAVVMMRVVELRALLGEEPSAHE